MSDLYMKHSFTIHTNITIKTILVFQRTVLLFHDGLNTLRCVSTFHYKPEETPKNRYQKSVLIMGNQQFNSKNITICF